MKTTLMVAKEDYAVNGKLALNYVINNFLSVNYTKQSCQVGIIGIEDCLDYLSIRITIDITFPNQQSWEF